MKTIVYVVVARYFGTQASESSKSLQQSAVNCSFKAFFFLLYSLALRQYQWNAQSINNRFVNFSCH